MTKWHANLVESVRKRLGLSYYCLIWVSFIKGVVLGVVLVRYII